MISETTLRITNGEEIHPSPEKGAKLFWKSMDDLFKTNLRPSFGKFKTYRQCADIKVWIWKWKSKSWVALKSHIFRIFQFLLRYNFRPFQDIFLKNDEILDLFNAFNLWKSI